MEELKVKFYNLGQVEDKLLKFAVIVSRSAGKWIYCVHKERKTYEVPGGRREAGEDILQTARRELYEETGAVKFDFKPICIYSVVRGSDESFGLLCFADIFKFSPLAANSEIAKTAAFDTMPENLTYPLIQPLLFKRVQEWLNLQSAKDEVWDIYDENRVLTGRTHLRGEPLNEGDYHLVVHAWLQNSKGEFLVTKRAANKGFANMWECTGGSAVLGDDSISAAIREVKEETGLDVKPQNASLMINYKRENDFLDVWLIKQDFDLENVVLQENETIDAQYASIETIREMVKSGRFIPYSYLESLFEKAKQ